MNIRIEDIVCRGQTLAGVFSSATRSELLHLVCHKWSSASNDLGDGKKSPYCCNTELKLSGPNVDASLEISDGNSCINSSKFCEQLVSKREFSSEIRWSRSRIVRLRL